MNSINIQIKTISLSNKKLSKSIFNQIEFKDCFDKNLDFIGTEYYGYIKDKGNRFLIWNADGKLKKTNLTVYSDLREIHSFDTHNEIDWFLKKCAINFNAYDDRGRYKIELTENEQIAYNASLVKIREFIKQVLNDQIFI